MSQAASPFSKFPMYGGQFQWIASVGNFLSQSFGFLRVFRSVQLAIVLLSLLGIGVLVGVFMPQEGLVEVANIKQQFGKNYYLFKAMGLFNVYSSAWFIAVEVLFFFSMLFGSFQWLKPAWLAATTQSFLLPPQIKAKPDHFTDHAKAAEPSTIATLVQTTLKSLGYKVFIFNPLQTNNIEQAVHNPVETETSDNTNSSTITLYATKGNFSRIAPVVVHFGILCLLLGSLYGAFTGFKANQLMVPGQAMSFPNFDEFNPNMSQPYWQGSVPDYSLKLHDFNVHYYPDNPQTPKQYYSDLEVLDSNGQTVKRQTLSVNVPLQLNDLMIYQASFAPTGKLFLEVDGKPTAVEVNTTFQNRPISMSAIGNGNQQGSLIVFPFFTSKDPGTLYNNIRIFIHKGSNFVGAAPGQMPENLQLFEGEVGTIDGHTIKFIKPELATGFLVKQAPETWWVYLAFAIISLGTIGCIFSQRQIWVSVAPEKSINAADNNTACNTEVAVHFKTNKAKLSFSRELIALQEKLKTELIRLSKNTSTTSTTTGGQTV